MISTILKILDILKSIVFDNPLILVILLLIIIVPIMSKGRNVKLFDSYYRSQKKLIRKEKKIQKETEKKVLHAVSSLEEIEKVDGIPIGFMGRKKKKYYYVPASYNPPNMLMQSGAGGGKTSSVIIPQIELINNLCGITFDTAGDIASNCTHDNVLIYEPEKHNLKYNILGLVDLEREKRNKIGVERAIDDIVYMLFPNTNFSDAEESGAKYFYDSGKAIVASCLHAFYPLGKDIKEIVRILNDSSKDELLQKISATKNEKAISIMMRFRDTKDRDFGESKGTATKKLELFINETYLDENNIGRGENSFDMSIINEKFLIVRIPASEWERYLPLVQFMSCQALLVAQRRQIGQLPRQYFIFDEFASILRGTPFIYEQIVQGTETLRKYNSRMVFSVQSIASLIDIVGKKERVNAILENIGIFLTTGGWNDDDRNYICNLVGKETVYKTGVNKGDYNESLNYQFVQENKLSDQASQKIDDDYWLLVWRGGYKKIKKLYYFKEQYLLDKIEKHRLKRE